MNHLFQQLIQIIPVLQHDLPQNGRLKKYGDQKQHQKKHGSLCHIEQPQEKIPVNLLFFPHKKPNDVKFVAWFMLILKYGPPRM